MADPLDVPMIQAYVRDASGNTYKVGGPAGGPGIKGDKGDIGDAGDPGPQSYAQVSVAEPTPRDVGDIWVNPNDTLLEWDDDWQIPTLLNGWVWYGASYATVGYRKLPGGLVILKGMVKSGTANSTMFTLPVGYRPAGLQPFPVLAGSNTPNGRVDVNNTGDVIQVEGLQTWVSLANISFMAEQ